MDRLTHTASTLYGVLVDALQQAAQYNQADAVAPVCVLWTDAARQWEPLLPRLREELPVLTLGPYDPASRTGPAIWLRCMIAQKQGTGNREQGTEKTVIQTPDTRHPTPILYLPGISRQELRAVDECPRLLQPLAELQYRGVLWTHKNGRDWTIAGLLQAHESLQIEVSTDSATKEALQRALLKLADEPVSSLRAEAPLTAAKLNALMNPEPVKNLLLWMNDPVGQRAKQSDDEWAVFRAICQQQFGFDPATEGEMTAALLLGRREGAWSSVWTRLAEAPARYSTLPDLLRRARPANPDGLFHDPSSWPQDNEAAELALRDRLAGLKNARPADARKEIRELEKAHGERQTWVWAELGYSPLTCILPALTTLADVTETPLGGATP